MIARPARPVPPEALGEELRERLILYGTLTEPDDADVIGVALVVQAPGRDAVVQLLESEPTLLDATGIEVHDWEFGGRR